MVRRSGYSSPRYQTRLGTHVREVLEKHAIASALEDTPRFPEWQQEQASVTFRLLGDSCTRKCSFCSVPSRRRLPKPDSREPKKIANAVEELGAEHVILTSVQRDDLRDYGAGHFGRTISAIKDKMPYTVVEAIVPDFRNSAGKLEKIIDAGPDIVAHNIETVRRLAPLVRDRRFSYSRSLGLLGQVKELDPEIATRSTLMVGMGERWGEVLSTMRHLRRASVDEIKICQYLRPTSRHPPVREYISAGTFEWYERAAYQMGFWRVSSSALSRGSGR